jgi:hypothetical protein
MLDVVAQDRLTDRVRVLLVVEFGRMDADDHQLLRVLLFQPDQIRNDVHAVDAAEGPEVQEDDLSLQVLQLDRLVGVEPADAALEIGGFPRGALSWPRPATGTASRTRAAAAIRCIMKRSP